MVDADEVKATYGYELLTEIEPNSYEIVILAVPHSVLVAIDPDSCRIAGPSVVFDVRGGWSRDQVDGRL